jgi:hypothetical protein
MHCWKQKTLRQNRCSRSCPSQPSIILTIQSGRQVHPKGKCTVKIKYLTGPKSGQIDHVPNSQEFQVLASAGIIEIVPYKDFRERLAAEMAATPTLVKTVSWGIKHCTGSPESQPESVLIFKTTSLGANVIETMTFTQPPADCPPSVVAHFRREAGIYAQIRQDREHAQKTDFANKNQPLGRPSRVASEVFRGGLK